MYNLLGLGLRFESHIPENVVDQMNDILVQHEHRGRERERDGERSAGWWQRERERDGERSAGWWQRERERERWGTLGWLVAERERDRERQREMGKRETERDRERDRERERGRGKAKRERDLRCKVWGEEESGVTAGLRPGFGIGWPDTFPVTSHCFPRPEASLVFRDPMSSLLKSRFWVFCSI